MSAVTTGALTQALAERSSELSYDALPDDVVELARQSLLDWFAVTLGGSGEQGTQMLLDVLTADAPRGDHGATVVGHTLRLPAPDAALVNGTSSHYLDFDDVNVTFLGHASVAVLAAALALAEQLDADAGQLLAAYVAGYETVCALAVAIGPEPYRRGYHVTGTLGAFGASAACARLLELDFSQTAIASGIAASQAAGLKCNFGTMTKSLHAGRACQNGLLAALLAARGFTASPRAIEAEQGFAAVMSGETAAETLDAGALCEPPSGWHLRENLFKYHASCFFTHSAIEGLRELAGATAGRLEQVERVTLHISEVERGTCAIAAPTTGLEAKFSIAHLAAMALLGRPTTTITDEDAHDAEVVALRSRVELLDDGTAGAPTRVEISFGDGSSLTAAHDASRPCRDPAAQRGRLAAKFTALAEPVLGAPAARTLLGALEGLDAGAKMRSVMALAHP